MFVFVGGVSPHAVSRDLPARECPACGAVGAMQERRVDSDLSLFFVRVLTLERGAPFLACTRCGWTSMAGSGGNGAPAAGAVAQGPACPHCGSDVQRGWQWCPFCGGPLW
ncbi:hypothetical protein Rsub_03358 [Raphidocelis subcapitata]|uniref:Zinc-ribbon 15 domain-containing protein n=1 Tax=Raphidocelis subcapitata TaxID=307507 RepID=A0A2V0NZI6_9CHLO|nr:hypothetical protein Rsub_03358 [Raphidocelis subcapitata]|eukprot:GBF90225.1 hypothetical protein Rsub_03358 [Raphidocelis subcapitata]